jgi:hypothetical protein
MTEKGPPGWQPAGFSFESGKVGPGQIEQGKRRSVETQLRARCVTIEFRDFFWGGVTPMPHPELFGAVVALVVAAAYFILTQRWKRRATDDDDGPGWQLMPPGSTPPTTERFSNVDMA